MSGRFDITIEQGAVLSLPLTLKNTNGTAFDLTGYTGRGQIRKFHRSTSIIASFTVTIHEAGVLTLKAAPTVAGTGYAVGEVLTITTGGTGGTATVLTITGGGATGPVGTVSLRTSGKDYTTGAGKVTTSSGPGINCTLEILTIYDVSTMGKLTVSLTAIETAAISAGEEITDEKSKYVYDLEIISGATVKRILEGFVFVSPEVTR